MLIIPAIDLKNGKVVRLRQGDFLKEKVYSDDALAIARKWADQGASFIHIVDLDGVNPEVSTTNLDLAGKIAKEVLPIPVELGGGIRTEKAIKDVLDQGIKRVVLGTKACQDPEFAEKIINEFGDKVIVSIDSRGGKIQTDGWTKTALQVQFQGPYSSNPVELAKSLKKFGAETIIYTDISKDGMLTGPDVGAIKQFLKESGIKIIVAGGITSPKHIKKLKKLEGVEGVIIGKALYEGKIDLSEAIKIGK